MGKCCEAFDGPLPSTLTKLLVTFFFVCFTQRHLAEGNTVFVFNEKRGTEEHVDSRLQWQLNLLTHIENVQNEVSSRMDLIEKEVDGNYLNAIGAYIEIGSNF